MKNINFGLIFKWFFVWAGLHAAFPQADSLRIMSYNLLMYPSGTSYSRDAYLTDIVASYSPDIFAVCELETARAADRLLNNVMQPIDPDYAAADFEPNHSDPNGTLQQLVFYNRRKLVLYAQSYVITEVRDINRYDFYLRSPYLQTGDTIFIHVYVVHLKSSQGYENEQKRYRMISALLSDAAALPSEHYTVVAGDFNFYYDGEPGFEALTDTAFVHQFQDPVHREGYWHENRTFAPLHTQSPNRNKGGNFVGGGLDDRFDFIFLSANLTDSLQPVHYRTGSYAAYGNNGNCFNGNINDPACSGPYSQNLRDDLYEMSDHIPVVLTLVTDFPLTAAEKFAVSHFRIYPVPAKEFLHVEAPRNSRYAITDQTGKIIMRHLDGKKGKWYIGHLKPGIYYIRNETYPAEGAAFIKL